MTSTGRLAAALLAALFAAPLLARGDEQPAPADDPAVKGLEPGLYARLDTTLGTMVLRLHYEQVPVTVANFVGLIEGTIPFETPGGEEAKRPFYDGLTFHRVIDGFMIQGGCPLGTGMGGPGYSFRDELPKDRGLRHDGPGVLSMANSDRGKQPWSATGTTNGSQFFITLAPTPHLDGLHSVFGKLVRGEEVLRAIGKTPTGPQNRPRTPVKITKASVVRIGEEAEAFDAPQVFAEREERLKPAPGFGPWRPKDVPEAKGEPDPARVPAADAPERDPVEVQIICIQYAGCARARRGVTYTKEQALEVARKIVPLCREKGADFVALAERWSDLPVRTYPLQKAQNDPSLAPAFRLAKGQVSDPTVTPFGVMIFCAE